MKGALLFIAFILCSYTLFAQPANDNCNNAITILVNTDNTCNNFLDGTTVNATQSQPGCVGIADDDVWYRFVATSTRHHITAAEDDLVDVVFQVFSGSCAGLTALPQGCVNATNAVGEAATFNNLAIGTSYYIRIYSASANPADQGVFYLCVSTPAPPPANDECSGAIVVATNPDDICNNYITGTNLGGTQSLPGCSGSGDDDVWYRFTATSPSHRVSVIPDLLYDAVFEVFSGSCAGLVSLPGGCVDATTDLDPESAVFNNLTIGASYYIRVYGKETGIFDQGDFELCISTPPPPAVNDNCGGAITLTVNPGFTCVSNTAGATFDATQSQPGCSGNADDDVWYRFTAAGPVHTITVEPGTLFDPVFEVFSGSCGTLTPLPTGCVNSNAGNLAESASFNSFVTGSVYFVRVHSFSGDPGDVGSFTICVSTPPPPPNDNCSNAEILTVNPGIICSNAPNGFTNGATQSQPGCTGSADDDVWYLFTATYTRHRITVSPDNMNDAVFEVFSGACGTLTPLPGGCINLTSGSAIEAATFTSLGIGITYYVRVYSLSPDPFNQGSFSICVAVDPLPPANDNCTGAITLTVNAGNACANTASGITIGASESMPGCFGTADDDVWYRFTATGSIHNISVIPGSLVDPEFEILSGSCGTLTPLPGGCVNITGVNEIESSSFSSLVPGNVYFVRVYSYSDDLEDQGTFSICISTPTNGEGCESPIILVPSAGETAISTDGTTVGYSASGQSPCAASAFIDIWYKFTVSSIHNIIKVLPVDVNANTYTSVYRGNCAGLAALVCNSLDTAIGLTDLTVGEEIIIRIHSNNKTVSNAFRIAVITAPASNNECAGAFALSIAASSNTRSLSGTTRGTTQSQAACSGGNPANDVWFSLVAGSDSFAIEIDHLGINNINSQLFTGSCGSLTPAVCRTTDNIITVSNPAPGQAYFLRLYSSDGSAVAYFVKAYIKTAAQKNTTLATTCLFNNQAANPGFEAYDICPTSFVAMANEGDPIIPNWTFPTWGTSDYFNSCSDFNATIEVPRNNCFGKQSPRSGTGYVGLFVYSGDALSSYREYIQGKLPAPLVPGKRYLVSYYVNLGDLSDAAINRLGVYFSTTKTQVPTYNILALQPQLVSPASQFFTDKDGWVNVSAILTADQPYEYFVIGNFNYDELTSNVRADYGSLVNNQVTGCVQINTSYINIDDVSISEINEVAIGNNCNTTIPLTLINFDAKKQATSSLLSWSTVYESNTKHFEVERSDDGVNFYKLGTVAAGINTGGTVRNYNFTDDQPMKGINFYRLKMLDQDGRFTYSDIRRVVFESVSTFSVYPNPVTDRVTLTGLDQKGSIQLFSADGKMLQQHTVTSTSIIIDMSLFAKGVYLLQYRFNGEVEFRKIIKQ